MILQNYFSFNRFYKALKYDLTLNVKTYLFFVVGLFFGLLFIDLWYVIINSSPEIYINDYSSLFFVPFIISIIMVVGTSFPLLRNKKSAANYLMLPASFFEKFLIQFIIRIVCFFMVYMILFWIDFKIAKVIYNLFEWRRYTEIGTFDFFDPFNYKGFKTTLDVVAAICWLVTLSSFLFAGATYFKKYALFKSVLSFVLIVFIGFLVFSICTFFFFPEKFDFVMRLTYMNEYKIHENMYNVQLFLYVIGIVSSLFLLPLAYFKLKEKEL